MKDKQSLPQKDQLDFIDDKTAALLLSAPKSTRMILWTIVLFFVIAFIWASQTQLDTVTRGTGRVVPSSKIQIVQNLEGGLVKQLFVKEGDFVKKGQTLLLIDDTQFRSNFNEQEQQRHNLEGDILRINAELKNILINSDYAKTNWRKSVNINNEPLQFSQEFEAANIELVRRQRNNYKSDISNLRNQLSVVSEQITQKEQQIIEIKSQVRSLTQNYNYTQKKLRITRPLANEGIVPQIELIKLQQEQNDNKQKLDAAKLSLPKIDAAIKESIFTYINTALEFKSKQESILGDSEDKLATLNKSKVGLEDRVSRTTVLSPTTGTINKLNINTVGGVIQPGMDIMEIVPSEDSLLIEAQIAPKDVAFLHPGLKAIVKLTAYNFSTYGGMDGTLETISADTQEDKEGNSFYVARIRTTQNHLGKTNDDLPIIPGMTASVDILTGKRTILDYLLRPILKASQTALRE